MGVSGSQISNQNHLCAKLVAKITSVPALDQLATGGGGANQNDQKLWASVGDTFLKIAGDQLKKWWVTFSPIFNVVGVMSPMTSMVAKPLQAMYRV